jgi:hypothetical protein
MVTQTTYKGTAGAFMVIAILLGSMAYNNMDFNYLPLGDIEDDAIFVDSNIVYSGEEVVFNLNPALMSDHYGIQYLMWDFHDNSYIVVSTKEDTNIIHTFEQPGEYLVSVLALKGNESRIFTIPMTVLSEPHDITITCNTTVVYEDEPISFIANTSAQFTPILNYLWLWGDGQTSFGKVTNHSYTEEGEYTVKVEGYTNDSVIHSSFIDITVNNMVPQATVSAKRSVLEDEVVELKAIATDSPSDMDKLHYLWQFDDGTMTQGAEVKKIFTESGLYDVILTLIDDNGARSDLTVTIQVSNGDVSIYNVYQLRDTYFEGQTITSFANFTENASDYPYLDYDWNIDGDGSEVSIPYYGNGDLNVNVTITDDDGSYDSASSDTISVLNVKPYASLISAVANYDIEFIMWGTVGSKADITLFHDGVAEMNFSITNLDASYNESRVLYKIQGLQQPIDEYWDILINMNDTVATFDTYVGVNFISTQDTVNTVNHCSSPAGSCLNDSYRLPTAPVDRGIPVNYNFSVFDPGNDNVTLYMNVGSDQYSESLSITNGSNIGFINITAYLPSWNSVDDISYWIVDDDGASSDIFNLPFVDYYLLPRPDEYISQISWEYWGNYLSHYAPISVFDFDNIFETGAAQNFRLITPQDPNTLNYTWSFGTGDISEEMFPVFTYEYRGQYLLWVVINDGYYEHVEYRLIDVSSPIPEFTPIVQGMPFEGNSLNFMASGMANDLLKFQWDFGDGTYGFGETFEHEYTNPGNYTVFLRIYDRYNVYDEYELLIMIFNAAPEIDGMMSTYEVIEGSNIAFAPHIKASPYDLISLEFDWLVNDVEYTDKSLWFKQSASTNYVSLIVYDADGANGTHTFTFNVTEVPIILRVPSRSYIYGDPNLIINISGSISSSVFNTITDTFSLEYRLHGREGDVIGSGFGEIQNNRVTLAVNTSMIGTDREFEALRAQLYEPEDLTDDIMPSGAYSLRIVLFNDTEVVSRVSSTLQVTIDKDGDFITDELEILLSNVLDDPYFTNSTDSNNNGVADPVEYVIHNDADGDGLPKMVEDIYGTSDNNPDSDGDGLTDGFGPFGEMQLGTIPTKKDTDGDLLDDGVEVIGWSVELITPDGLVIKQVSSSPLKQDTDNDGVSDFYEFNLKIDPRESDTDFDGLNDLEEQDYGTSLQNADTDFDGISDYDEATRSFNCTYTKVGGIQEYKIYYLNPLMPDSDEDGISDYDEVYLHLSIGTSSDTDSDGILDADELVRGTDILNADTDGDGLADGIEIAGFEIPIILMQDGVYSENGTVITEPTVSNYTIQVYTNPLDADTDGDGLTDYEELLGDNSTVSDPTSVDGDGDGIIDPLDPQKLVSDFTPANITSDISVIYCVKPGETTKIIVKTLKSSLSLVWSLMKSSGRLALDLLKSFWYMKKVCVWRLCVKIPWLRSWSSIKANIAWAFRTFALTNLPKIFDALGNFNDLFTNTLSLVKMGITVLKRAGIPYGLSISGGIQMIARSITSIITHIVEPTVKFSFDAEDDAGIDKIVVYQDGIVLKEINNINSKTYTVNEEFKVVKDGYKLESTTIMFAIHDINGNIRLIERTTNLKEFTKGMLKQGITFIKEVAEAIIKKVKDIWDWAMDGLEYLGNKIIEVVKVVGNFINDTYHRVKDWVKEQFEKIWAGFVRETLNLLQRGKEYWARADVLLDDFTEKYQSARATIHGHVDDALTGSIMTTINDTLNSASDLIEEYIPPVNEEGIKNTLNKFLGPLKDLYEGSIIETAYEFIAHRAIELLGELIEKHLGFIVNSTIFKYVEMMVYVVKDVFSRFVATIPESFPIPSLDAEDDSTLIDLFVDSLVFLRNPASAIVDLISAYDADFVMEVIDEFMLDNEDYLMSINDIMRKMLKPGMIVGMVAYDIINWVGDIFKSSFVINDVSTLGMTQHGISSILDLDDGYYTFDIVSGIIDFVGNIVGLIVSEISKITDVIDMEDLDREGFAALIYGVIDFILLCTTSLNTIVASIVGSFEYQMSEVELKELTKDFILLTLAIINTAYVLIVTIATFGNDGVEKLITAHCIIWDFLYNLVDFAMSVFFYFKYIVDGDFSAYSIIKGWFDWRVQGAMAIYDFIATISLHGTLLLKIPPIGPIPIGQILWAAYTLLGVSQVSLTLVLHVVETVAIFAGWE